MWSEGNAPKYGEPAFGFSFNSAPAHRSVLIKDFFFSKEQYDKTGAFSILPTWFHLIFTFPLD
jgi:hypothetical protein